MVRGFPDWLIEYGKNTLSLCDDNALLFVAGDVDFNVCSYLQICENFRTDVTVMPLPYVDRPWFVSYLKNGLDNVTRNINMSLTEEQIMNIRPYKWRETDVYIGVSQADKLKYGLTEDFKMKWLVEPDLQSWRMHSKIEGEEASRRTFLSPQRAILLQIIEDNLSERPIYFTNAAESTFYGGLNEYFQNCGLISQLTPIKTKDTEHQINISKLEQLFKTKNFIYYKSIKDKDFPRVSKAVAYGYLNSFVDLAYNYSSYDKEKELKLLMDLYKSHLMIGFDFEFENMILNQLEKK